MQHIIKNAKNFIADTTRTIFLTSALVVVALCLTTAPGVRADQTLATTVAGAAPVAVAANPVTNRTYVANQDSNNVTVNDGTNNSVIATVAAGTSPAAVAVNTETNRIYVANFDSNNITVINGADNSTQTIAIGSVPFEIAVNPITNRIYAARETGGVRVINGADNTTTNFVTSDQTNKVAVNPATNKIYVTGLALSQVDGAVNQNPLYVQTNNPPRDIVFNAQTDQVFVPIPDSNTVTVLTPTTTVAAPLNTTVAPSGFSNNTTTSRTPTFNLTANSTDTRAPRNIYYQFDTKQGDWLRAVLTSSTATTLTATGVAPFLTNGIHTIYFFAADATSSTNINPLYAVDNTVKSVSLFDRLAPEASPITGQIGSYQFLVSAPTITTAATVTVSGRAQTAKGKGIRNARVTLTDANGNSQMSLTGVRGNYKFTDLAAGNTYIISVTAKHYTFVQSSRVLSINEDLEGVDFVAEN